MQTAKPAISIRTLCWGVAVIAAIAFIAAVVIIPSNDFVLTILGGAAVLGFFLGLFAGDPAAG